VKRNSVRWLYRLDRAYSWESGCPVGDDFLFFDKQGKLRLVVETSGRITVLAGYAWNGCSPKVCLFDILWGTPDGVVHARTGRPKTYFASLIHDALCQFFSYGLPYNRPQVDHFFLRLMEESEFGPRKIYWLAVRAFDRITQWVTQRKRKNRGEVRHAADHLDPPRQEGARHLPGGIRVRSVREGR